MQPNSNISAASAAQAYQIYQHMLARLRHLPHVTGLATADAVNAAMLDAARRVRHGAVHPGAARGQQ